MTNLINRLQLDVSFSDQDHAFNMRHNFAQTYQQQIEEVVDYVCSKYVGESEWLKIDKLEMDLGHFMPNGFRHNFAAVFLFHFEKALTAKLSEVTTQQRETSQLISQVELVEYFLQNGTLPWFANEDEINLEELINAIVTRRPEVLQVFLERNKSKPSVWKRLSYQVPDEVKATIVNLFEVLKNAEDRSRVLVQEFFYSIGRIGGLNEMSVIYQKTRNVILEDAPVIFEDPFNVNLIRKVLRKRVTLLFPENTSEASLFFNNENGLVAETHLQNHEQEVLEKAKAEAIEMLLAQATKNVQQKEERFVVKHAGVLLLAPFFNPFFTRLQLLAESEWINKEAQYKAVHLLKFLVTGRRKFPEFTLILEKIICGLAIEEPVPSEMELLEDDLAEGVDLLKSVIEHWKVLKNTSVDGLREAFLKREGIVTRNEKAWLVQVERRTHDVLLDSIPWGYSTILLPWNDYTVSVEW